MMGRAGRRGNAGVLAAIAAITGQTPDSLEEAFRAATQADSDTSLATTEEVARVINLVRTRLGMAPAVDREALQGH
ncbi:hypothetical protein AWC22_01405 [Mycobacterium riyadhense]|uniref:Uncharacterized protein n=1 Tax=Mycobacterium riyadhense TaxID=486698 RepID=A0A1X2CBB4_9MYCO|nr:hypothetical protein AWC22_01405 [Mycobacterium riyadhense]